MMEKDDTLEEMFRGFEPKLKDDDTFMRNLNRRLEAVEYLKAEQDRQLRLYKYAVIAAFVTGIISGGILFNFFLKHPEAMPTLSFDTQIPQLSFLLDNTYTIALSVIALLISYTTISVINLIQEIRSLK